MAVHALITPAPSGATLARLLPRRHTLQRLVDQAEAICRRLAAPCPTPRALAAELLLNHLCAELWALDLVILALTPADNTELAAQARIARASVEEHLPSMRALDTFLTTIVGVAA